MLTLKVEENTASTLDPAGPEKASPYRVEGDLALVLNHHRLGRVNINGRRKSTWRLEKSSLRNMRGKVPNANRDLVIKTD